MRNLMIAVILLTVASPCFAGESLQVYGGGQKLATVCASLEMYEGISLSGVFDINRTGWFTRPRLVEDTGIIVFAQELRASSSGQRQLAVSVQLNVKDPAGTFQVNPWYDEDGNWLISICQSHKLTDHLWTFSWTDFSHHEAKGTVRVGHKESAHMDIFAEYRLDTKTRDNGIFAGINLH